MRAWHVPDLIQSVPQGVLVLLQPHSLSLCVLLLCLQHGDGSLQRPQSLLDGGPLHLSRLGAALGLCQTGRALLQKLVGAKTQWKTCCLNRVADNSHCVARPY